MTVTLRKTTCRVCGVAFMLDSIRETLPGIGCHPETCMLCEVRKMERSFISAIEMDNIFDLVNRESKWLAEIPPTKKATKERIGGTMKVQKRPVIVEAEQFWPDKLPWPAGVVQRMEGGKPYGFVIHTLEGEFTVTTGDWIITGVKGERCLVKGDVFEATYDRLPD